MTLTDMRYVVSLAQERHFGRAAAACYVSQPTLSVALKKIEQRLGAALFERLSTEVRLTSLGERVAQEAQCVLDAAMRLDEMVAQAKDPLVGPLRLGAIYTIAPYLLPRILPALHLRAPKMPLYLQEAFTARLADRLRQGDLDVAVLALPFAMPGIVTQIVYEEPFCVALPVNHPLARQKTISSERLAAEQLLVLGQGNCFRDQVVQACPQLQENGGLERALEGSSLETLRHMVASGAGVAVVPASAVATWAGSEALMTIRPFARPVPTRRVVLAWRVSFPRPQVIDVLRAAILAAPPAGVSPLSTQ